MEYSEAGYCRRSWMVASKKIKGSIYRITWLQPFSFRASGGAETTLLASLRTWRMSNTIALQAFTYISLWFLLNSITTRYPLSNFTFRFVYSYYLCLFKRPRTLNIYVNSTKEAQPEEDPSVSARLQRLQNNYEDFGMRRTVEGILVVHDHGHPHILMLQIANAFFKL